MLVLIIFLVNTNNACPPPYFVLNPSNFNQLPTFSKCAYPSITSTPTPQPISRTTPIFDSSYVTKTSLEDNPPFLLFNVLCFGVIIPLGITSIIFSFSKKFIPKWKNWTSDGIKIIKMILCTIILAIQLIPIGFSISFITEKCFTSPIMIMILDLLLLLICFGLSWLDAKRILSVFKKKRSVQNNGSKQTGANQIQTCKRMLISVILFLFGLVTLSLALFHYSDDFVPQTCSVQFNYAVIFTIGLSMTSIIYHTIMITNILPSEFEKQEQQEVV